MFLSAMEVEFPYKKGMACAGPARKGGWLVMLQAGREAGTGSCHSMGLELDHLQPKLFSDPVVKTQNEEEAELHLSTGPAGIRQG